MSRVRDGTLEGRSVRGLALLLGCLLPTPAPAADFIWEPPVPVSPPAAEGSHRFHELLRGPGKDFVLRAIVSRRTARYSVRGYDLTVGRNLDWQAAWRDRTEFTYDNGLAQSAFEIHAAIDSRGRIHVAYEAFDVFGGKSIDIGYKTDGSDAWNGSGVPVLIADPRTHDCMGANPGICIGRGADGKEWVHVLYHRRPLLGGDVGPDCHPFAYVYRGKPTSSTDPAAGWGPESIFTDEFLAQEFVVAGEGGVGLMPLVDRRGRIHAIGRRRDGADSVSVCHLSGMPPGPRGSWKTERWVLDTMPLAEPVAPGHEPPYASPLQAACSGPRGAEVLDVVWNRNVRGRDVIWREIWFARLDLERDVWSSPVRIAGDADTPAFGARIARSEDGTVHAVYHIVAQDTGLMGLAYRRTNGDPCDAASWSTLEILTDPDRSLLGPVFVADCDTLWLGYTTERADQPPSHRWQAWFRKGYVATPFAAK